MGGRVWRARQGRTRASRGRQIARRVGLGCSRSCLDSRHARAVTLACTTAGLQHRRCVRHARSTAFRSNRAICCATVAVSRGSRDRTAGHAWRVLQGSTRRERGRWRVRSARLACTKRALRAWNAGLARRGPTTADHAQSRRAWPVPRTATRQNKAVSSRTAAACQGSRALPAGPAWRASPGRTRRRGARGCAWRARRERMRACRVRQRAHHARLRPTTLAPRRSRSAWRARSAPARLRRASRPTTAPRQR
mmetsp:Transcript_16518/g.39487  ORF Transcript_16518/g.39487 Transcript_16518/m.39487 type:complete len:251 (+) Transcript_16518:75-827(+)